MYRHGFELETRSASAKETTWCSEWKAIVPSSHATRISCRWPERSRFPQPDGTPMGRRHPQDTLVSRGRPPMTAFVDTNILVRHLTGDPPAMAKRATAFLAGPSESYLADLVVAETVNVLESFYEAPRDQVATAMRSLIAMRSMVTESEP